METIFLVARPGEISAAGQWGKPLAHAAYRMGAGPHLFRANGPMAPRGGLMVIEDVGFAGGEDGEGFGGEVLRECASRRFSGVVCRFQGYPGLTLEGIIRHLGEQLARRGLSLFVEERYAGVGVGQVLIPTALSGGTLRGRLEEAGERYGRERLALWVDRVGEDLTLPSPTGSGTSLTLEELKRLREERGGTAFFSAELCERYFTYMEGQMGHFVLFDDASSISHKLALAAELGISTAFLPYGTTSDLLEELWG